MNLFLVAFSSFVLIGLAASEAAVQVDISPPMVILEDDQHRQIPVTLECLNQLRSHQYCCWTGPGLEDCSCDSQDCEAIEGATVETDQKSCRITLERPANYPGNWSCDLYFIKHGNIKRSGTTQIYVIDENEVPKIIPLFKEKEVVLDQLQTSYPARYECSSGNPSPPPPGQTYQWYLDGNPIKAKVAKTVNFTLTRNHFNHSLQCQIHSYAGIGGDGQVYRSTRSSSFKLLFEMSPLIEQISRLESSERIYEIQVQSWPKPKFVKISSVEECNNQCVIYKLLNNDRYVMDTSPYLNESTLVKDVTFVQVSGADVKIHLQLQINSSSQSSTVQEIFVGIGNEINVANAKIDLLHSDQALLLNTPGQDLTLLILAVTLVTILFIFIVALLIHFRTFIWESFKCGVYLVPSEDQEVESNGKEQL